MPRISLLVLLLFGSLLALSGCAAGIAASALGAAVKSARDEPRGNEHLKPLAVQECSARASQFGTVRVIDVEQRTLSKIIVWGTVTKGADRRSFECSYTTRVVGFQLRAVKA